MNGRVINSDLICALLPDSCQLTLDPNTAHINLDLSKQNRTLKLVNQQQPYPDHPERFTRYSQVLCKEALSGRCYWEVEWRGDDVDIAVSYKDISRTQYNSFFGNTNKSWSLEGSRDGYSFRHNRVETAVSGPQSSRVGVYLDHKASTLSSTESRPPSPSHSTLEFCLTMIPLQRLSSSGRGSCRRVIPSYHQTEP